VWDLPGGHFEHGEEETAALARELAEEIGVRIDTPEGPPLARLPLGAAESGELVVWVVRRWSGQPVNAAPEEHDELRWFRLEELHELRLPDPAYPELLRRAIGEGAVPPA
jgi:8-oxo-dGTP pyrophosphatase MutT (NUDIX family)